MPTNLAINNGGPQAGITTAFSAAQAIALTSVADANPMPAEGQWAHLELVMTVTGGVPTQVSAFLAWDAAGDNHASAVAVSTSLQAGLTTATVRCTSMIADTLYRCPAGVTPGTVYLFLKTDAGTVTLTSARLVWADTPATR